MAIKEIKKRDLTWVNIDRVDDASIKYLKDHYSFHPLDLEDIQSESQTPKIDVYKNYLFLVLHIPQWKAAKEHVSSHELNIFVGKGFLITIQHTKNKEIKNFFYRCMNNKKINKEWLAQGSDFLLYKLIESLFHQSRPMLNKIGRQISSIETEIFDGQQDIEEIRELAIYRRNVLNFRRIIDPQRYLMSNLAHTRKPFFDDSMALYFDNMRDYLDKLWAIVEGYKETISGLHLTVESMVTHRTNKTITLLTVMSAALLPLTLLSGIYGMNIDLPFSTTPNVVWGMFLLILFGIFAILYKMHRSKLL